ncbi:flavonoid 3-hydroxylase, putative [Paecilomyces variotii No. 5]|uniref:Flavonoid 3-hydroxylase, putative n=1 Tax=Byssochlamys spectabilis (strain No. 5 / NBRC 109023) TaxID=1356009 RepID=V5FVI1_BYSSN|nr:flavonoid 3-hydroxylase, putative [Paecilomyces variotii No. 5]
MLLLTEMHTEVSNTLPSSTVALGFLLAGVVLYSIGLVTYRLTLHPLSKYPGPKLAGATKWYEFYFDCIKAPGGQFLWEVYRMHEQYGPIVRINPDELHVADAAWYEILNAAGGAIRHKYPPSANLVGTPLGVFGTIDHHVHRIRKAPVASYFARGSVLQFQPTMRSRVEALSGRLLEVHRQGTIIDLRLTFLAFSTDMLCVYGFGGPMGLLDSEEKALEWLDTMNAVAVVTPFFKQFPEVLPWLFMLAPWMIKKIYPAVLPMLTLHRKMRQHATEAWSQYSQESRHGQLFKESRAANVFESILYSNIPEHEKSIDRLAQDAFLTITAGGDPAARTMAMTVYYLLSNPQSLELLHMELDKAMPDSSKVLELQELESLPVLTAVIKETMRIMGLTTSRLPLISDTPLQYEEWTIPAGIPVGMSIHQVLHDKRYFPDSETFRPERWLEARKDGVKLDHYYVPFGRGTRMCVGQHFAQAEIYLVIAAIFRRFDLRLVDTVFERDIQTVRDCFLAEYSPECKGIRVIITGERH